MTSLRSLPSYFSATELTETADAETIITSNLFIRILEFRYIFILDKINERQ